MLKKLPQNWCIKVNADCKPTEVYNWRITNSSRGGWDTPGYIDSEFWWSDIIHDCTEITLEDFKRLVLKQSITALPEKWYCKGYPKVIEYSNKYGVRATRSSFRDKYNEPKHYYAFPAYDDCTSFDCTESLEKAGYIELTYDEFKQLVIPGLQENHDNCKKKIVGYKLKESCEQYRDAAEKIAGYSKLRDPLQLEHYLKHLNGLFLRNLKAAGVLELWFEPVYEDGFKVGDWVVIDNVTNNFGGIIGHIGKIHEIHNELHYLTPSCTGQCWYKENLRFATAEEIKSAEEIKLMFGDCYWNVKKSDGTATSSHGIVTKQKIKEIVDYVSGDNTPSVLGNKLYLSPQTKIKFGCQTGTIEQLLNIYNELK
jgi:hypothetical protein